MQYRPEIDGLRAFAVVSVMLFHAKFSLFSGGFIGVDVFFVISGFLITSIILSDLEKGRFSIIEFYERRVRRIFPAIYCVLFVSIPFAWVLMLPDPLENYGQSIFATTLFSNNILLTITSGYWDLAVEFKPLVHTWSLAVEEQFYVIFPIFLILAFRFSRHLILLFIIVMFVISFLMAEWGWRNAPIANFYLLPFRAWELLAGAICAKIQDKDVFKNSSPWYSLIGLLMILYPVFAFDELTPFPSVYALLPVIGASIIVLYGHNDGIAKQVLSMKIIVWTGLISYSTYLWHQPLFAFFRIMAKGELQYYHYFGLIVLTFSLSYLTWKFVETPFRNRQYLSRFKIFTLSLFFSLVLVVIGATFHLQQGFAARIFDQNSMSKNDIYISYNSNVYQYKKDEFDTDKHVKVLVLGNSFARDFVNMMLENFLPSDMEIVYRNDFYDCRDQVEHPQKQRLIEQATLIIFASGVEVESCAYNAITFYETNNKSVFYIGTKQFGYNLNWLATLPKNQMALQTNHIMLKTINLDKTIKRSIPVKNYIDIIGPISKTKNSIYITDELGHLISGDRSHLTKYGAKFVGLRALNNPPFLKALKLPEDYFNKVE